MAASVNILTRSLDSTGPCATNRWTSLMKKTLLISLSMDVYSPRMAISSIKFHWVGLALHRAPGICHLVGWGSMMAKWHPCFFPLQWAGKGPKESSEELNLGGGEGRLGGLTCHLSPSLVGGLFFMHVKLLYFNSDNRKSNAEWGSCNLSQSSRTD